MEYDCKWTLNSGCRLHRTKLKRLRAMFADGQSPDETWSWSSNQTHPSDPIFVVSFFFLTKGAVHFTSSDYSNPGPCSALHPSHLHMRTQTHTHTSAPPPPSHLLQACFHHSSWTPGVVLHLLSAAPPAAPIWHPMMWIAAFHLQRLQAELKEASDLTEKLDKIPLIHFWTKCTLVSSLGWAAHDAKGRTHTL